MAARNMRYFYSFQVGAKLAKMPRYDDAIYLLSPLTSALPIF